MDVPGSDPKGETQHPLVSSVVAGLGRGVGVWETSSPTKEVRGLFGVVVGVVHSDRVLRRFREGRGRVGTFPVVTGRTLDE